MIGYTMVGTSDLDRSIRFYDPLFKELGLDVCWRDAHSVSWGKAEDSTYPRFFTGYPFNRQEANAGNGCMTAFRVDDPRKIERLYELAMQHGGKDEGKPGPRPQYGESFYGAYVRDPDGNKIAFVHY